MLYLSRIVNVCLEGLKCSCLSKFAVYEFEHDIENKAYINSCILQHLETQQQLAVAVSTDKRKDIMIEQLDKVNTLYYTITVLLKIIKEFVIQMIKIKVNYI